MAEGEDRYGAGGGKDSPTGGGRPREIACAALDAPGGPDTGRRFAADLADALGVYERMGAGGGERGLRRVEVVDAELIVPVGAAPPGRLVLVAGDAGRASERAEELLGRIAASPLPDARARVWALVASDDPRGDEATRALLRLAARLERVPGAWMGGVAVGGAALSAPAPGRARMGRLRERASVAVDGLVGAIRCDLRMEDAGARFGFDAPGGILRAPISIGGLEYRLRTRGRARGEAAR